MHESSFFAGISCITMCDILLYVFGEWYVYVLLRTFRCCMYDWILAAPDTFPPHYLGILEPSVFDSLLLLLSHNKDLTTLSFFYLSTILTGPELVLFIFVWCNAQSFSNCYYAT